MAVITASGLTKHIGGRTLFATSRSSSTAASG